MKRKEVKKVNDISSIINKFKRWIFKFSSISDNVNHKIFLKGMYDGRKI
jgi:hypothetical protein